MLPHTLLTADTQAELALFTDALERFCDAEIEPHYRAWEKAGIVPRELFLKMGDNGYLCADVPEQYGGSGANVHFSFAVIEVLAAKTDPAGGAKGVSLFLVDTQTPGFSRGQNLEKIGQHAGDTSELFFNDLRVPADALLGGIEGQGFTQMMRELPRERLVIGVQSVYGAQGALNATLRYVQERQAFGQPLAQFQNTRFTLAQCATEVAAAQAFLHASIAAYERGQLTPEAASALKLHTTEMFGRVADACLQLFGGYGYMAEYPISRFWTDARVMRIYGGTSEIMKEIIARGLLKP